jgi:hypothetical protein
MHFNRNYGKTCRIISTRSREKAIEWARRAPVSDNEIVEVRQIHEMPDVPKDVHDAA